jgi:hypothetical protein
LRGRHAEAAEVRTDGGVTIDAPVDADRDGDGDDDGVTIEAAEDDSAEEADDEYGGVEFGN